MGKRVSFFDYIMLTCLYDRENSYHREYAEFLLHDLPKEERKQFNFTDGVYFNGWFPDAARFNLAVHDLWQSYKRLDPNATADRVCIPYYAKTE